jgi:hypothetical protein
MPTDVHAAVPVAHTFDGENIVNRRRTGQYTARTVTAAVLLSLATFAGAALAAEEGATSAQTTLTTQTTTVHTTTASGAGPAERQINDSDERRIKAMHDKLMIKAPQEALWKDVAQVMRSNDDKMDALTAERHDKAATMSAVEDLRNYEEVTEQHAAGIKTFLPVFQKLYDSMSAEQKANADAVFRTPDRKTSKKTK